MKIGNNLTAESAKGAKKNSLGRPAVALRMRANIFNRLEGTFTTKGTKYTKVFLTLRVLRASVVKFCYAETWNVSCCRAAL